MPYAIALLAVVALLVAVARLRRRDLVDEVERFRHARSLTTSWSTQGPVELHVPEQEPVQEQ